MKYLKKAGFVLLLQFTALASLSAQEVLWSADFMGFFDNREYKSQYQTSQTLFGTRVSPEIGIGLCDNKHRVMVGASWIQPIGTPVKNSLLNMTAYYRYVSPSFKMSFGMFPRTQLVEAQPDAMVHDSLLYFNPNLRGALFQYETDKGYLEAFIDWRSMQTEQQREAFLISVRGRYNANTLFFGGHVVMNHLARSKNAPETMSVMDDMILHPYAGVDFSHRTVLDSLSLKCGYLLSMERNRGVGEWYMANGFLADLVLQWRWLGMKNTFYIGENQQPFYPEFGILLNQGDPFYQAKLYNRTNIYAYFFRNRFVNCLASFNLHCSDGYVDFQQQLTVRVNIDSFSWKERGSKSCKGDIFLKSIYQ